MYGENVGVVFVGYFYVFVWYLLIVNVDLNKINGWNVY